SPPLDALLEQRDGISDLECFGADCSRPWGEGDRSLCRGPPRRGGNMCSRGSVDGTSGILTCPRRPSQRPKISSANEPSSERDDQAFLHRSTGNREKIAENLTRQPVVPSEVGQDTSPLLGSTPEQLNTSVSHVSKAMVRG